MTRLLEEEAILVDEGELERVLERVKDHPVVFERDGIRYKILREPEVTTYDAEALRSILQEYAGFLSDDEAAEMKEYLRRGRQEGSQPFTERAIPG